MFDRHQFSLVPGIEPVDGWQLLTFDYEDGDGFIRPGFYAYRFGEYRLLNTSRFSFTPTQERFAWIVNNGFPRGIVFGQIQSNLWNDGIDKILAGEPLWEAA